MLTPEQENQPCMNRMIVTKCKITRTEIRLPKAAGRKRGRLTTEGHYETELMKEI